MTTLTHYVARLDGNPEMSTVEETILNSAGRLARQQDWKLEKDSFRYHHLSKKIIHSAQREVQKQPAARDGKTEIEALAHLLKTKADLGWVFHGEFFLQKTFGDYEVSIGAGFSDSKIDLVVFVFWSLNMGVPPAEFFATLTQVQSEFDNVTIVAINPAEDADVTRSQLQELAIDEPNNFLVVQDMNAGYYPVTHTVAYNILTQGQGHGTLPALACYSKDEELLKFQEFDESSQPFSAEALSQDIRNLLAL